MSAPASSGPNPAKYSPFTDGAGAVNHSSPVPETWMPNSVPLRAIATTMVDPGMSRPASAATLPAGMERLRKKWSLPLMNRNAATMSSLRAPLSSRSGVISRNNSEVAARLRLWHSSPICRAWAMRLRTSTGPRLWSVAASRGPSTRSNHRRRSMTSGEYAPYRRTFPRPSFNVQYARRPLSSSSSTDTGIEALTTPAMGPTAEREWQGASEMPPRAAIRPASSKFSASPS